MNGDQAVCAIQKNMNEFFEYEQWLENGGEASSEQLLMPKHFDVIILDLNMPILNGYEACKQIIEIYKDYN